MEEIQSVPTPLPLDPSTVVEISPLYQPSTSPSLSGVGNCYIFKSQLQEYAQKVSIPTPVYQTVKEGPSHEPVFRSTVIVNDVTYESLPGFFNRKVAEQSAAEIALIEIHKSGQMKENIPTVHETGLCKNMLQEYAQKMNYAIPSYKCNKQEKRVNPFICTVEIGGVQYIGAASRTRKEAEIKAARTALLAIQFGFHTGANSASQCTVLPTKKKGRVQESRSIAIEQLKLKKTTMKKKGLKRKFPRNKGENAAKSDNYESDKAVKSDNGESAKAVKSGNSEFDKETKSDNGESLNHVDKVDDASRASREDEKEQGLSEMKDEWQSQSNEFTTAPMETNGCHCDEQEDGSNKLKTERFAESLEGRIIDSVLVQEVKADVLGDISSAKGGE